MRASLQWQQQLFLLVGGRVELAAPLPGSSCPARPYAVVASHPRSRRTHAKQQCAAYMAARTLPVVPPELSSSSESEQTPAFFRLRDPGPNPRGSTPRRGTSRGIRGHPARGGAGVSLDVNKERHNITSRNNKTALLIR